MTKIYIVTSGEYSDYSIDRVFSTRELAEEYCDQYSDYCRIEEYPLDEAIPPRGEVVFKIVMDLDTKEATAPTTLGEEWDGLVRIEGDQERGRICFAVKSDSKARAIKIASERYAEVIAHEQIKYPFLRVGIIMRYNTLETPFYDYKTGEIVLVRGKISTCLPPFVKVKAFKII